jgi:hypothetical protein
MSANTSPRFFKSMIHNRGVPFVSVNLGSSTLVSALDVRGRMISPYGENAFGSKF